MSIRIAIVDDHPLLIKGLQTMLQHATDIEVTGTYQGGRELLNGLKECQPDVLLLDIQLQGQMGDELAPILYKAYPNMMILALTNMEHEYYIKAMLRHKVMGYVLKSSDEIVLLEAIRTVAKGLQYFDPTIRKQAVKVQRSVMENPTLTRREREILELIAINYSSNDIADKLFLSKRTVDNHRIHLLLKLDVKNSASLVKKAIDLGLIK
jgi:DNA-binding NarL/FixJ family response regulator